MIIPYLTWCEVWQNENDKCDRSRCAWLIYELLVLSPFPIPPRSVARPYPVFIGFRMRYLCVLLVALALVAADDDSKKSSKKSGGTSGSPRTRFFGGPSLLSPSVAGVQPVLGGVGSFGAQPTFGFGGLGFGNQGFGNLGGFGGLGGISGVVGGVSPGIIGGLSPGLAGGLGSVVAPTSGCRYWCRTPEGAAYCCENVNQPTNPIATQIVKPGQCPPVRPLCPRVSGPPVTCSNDGACGGVDKCCFDRCLGEHVCKPPLGFGR
ncbi:uncharacterized protein LOC143019071 [Oratosquilla oratoria]|uniref:uncharacterized protein LOC143019071 n=1 Tax=Oratosquilla oratoria TaxID=337810 RepID=UPI003F759E52